jgi:DNA polymerase-3 subunit delta'
MNEITLHDLTSAALERILQSPSHALLVVGARGMGKLTLAQHIAAQLLQSSPESYPYFRHIQPDKPDSIGIEQIRGLQSFLALKVPGTKMTSRIILIEDAHLLTTESQNALLKTLEEPPAGTMLILTVAHEQSLLPTIRSRAQVLQLVRPSTAQLTDYFAGQGHDAAAIKKALMLSGNLPGLTAALLQDDTTHPLYEATNAARSLLQKTRFERLASVDALGKQKQLALDMLYILQQMAHTALLQGAAEKRWTNVLEQSYKAETELLASGQPKLVLTNFMLQV